MATVLGQTRSTPGASRALMAVLFADLEGFASHMARDEARTLAFVETRLAEAKHEITQQGGRLVKSTGDGFLAVFPAASQAVEFAMQFQASLLPSEYAYRIGIHGGEVQQRGDDVFGHAVNMAARIEGFAPSGGVCVSHDVFSLIRHSSAFVFESIGAQRLKNIDGRHMLYAVTDAFARRGGDLPHAVEIETLGGLTVMHPDGPDLLNQPLAQAILGCLALSPGHAEGIVRLQSILGQTDRTMINQAVGDLETRLGDAVDFSGGVVRLTPGRVKVDLVEAEEALAQGRPAPFLTRDRLWHERLLAGLGGVSRQFTAWRELIRSEWKERFAVGLETELGRFTDPADPGVRDIATALLIIEEAHERAARWLIQHHVAMENPAAAQRVYDRLERVMRSRFDLSPRPETTAALRSMSAPQPARPTRARAAVPLRLQVHPFSAANPELQEKLGAFRSELMSGLACFRGWSIVEGVQVNRPEESATDYAVTLRQLDDQGTTVDLALVEMASGRLVWQDGFDIGSSRIEATRRKVVGRIAATLEVFITTDRTSVEEAGNRHEIIDEWLRGERLIGRWTPRAHDEAAAIFSDLTVRAPEFAPAFASLASILNVRHVVRPGLARDADASRRAHGLANQALELDPLDARNQLAVGWSAALDGAFDKASVNLDMAVRLNPHSPRTLMSCAMGFAFLGEHGRAAEHLAHSLDCAPVLLDYQWCYAASVYLLAGNAEAALEAAGKSGDKIIDNPGWTAAALVKLGRRSEAAVAYTKLVRGVSADWNGDSPATPAAIRDWFVNAYPFRGRAERDLLDEALSEAVQGLNRPLEDG